jgi:hypothetical protein
MTVDTGVLVTMASVFIGFLLFGGAYASYEHKRPPRVIWGLFTAAVVFITLVPLGIAVFWAS